MKIARIIDITNDTEVTFVTGADYFTRKWPDANVHVGDVYHVTLEPELKVIQKLCAGNPHLSLNETDAMLWRKPDKTGVSRMQRLWQRQTIRRAICDYLYDQGFVGIDMPVLVRGTTPDTEISSFALGDRYLVTSTEYQIKRMEIGGFDRIFTLSQNFRQGDRGRYRNAEFTMLEWARVGSGLEAIEQDAENFTRAACDALGIGQKIDYQGHSIDLSGAWTRMTVLEAIEQHIGITMQDFTVPSLQKALKTAGIAVQEQHENDQIFLCTVLLDHVQTFLGFDKPVFLTEWPSFQTSSALDSTRQGFTQRSELFIAGIELSDGFPSLTDAQKQRENFARQLQQRQLEGKESVALDQKYLDAMEAGFPSGAGMALGFDRLVMVLTNAPDIASVLAFSWDEL